MIELADVTYRYPAATTRSLRSVNLSIKAGEVVCLTGPSGSGKTTVTRLVNGLVPHFYEGELSGDIEVCGLVPRRVSSGSSRPRSRRSSRTQRRSSSAWTPQGNSPSPPRISAFRPSGYASASRTSRKPSGLRTSSAAVASRSREARGNGSRAGVRPCSPLTS